MADEKKARQDDSSAEAKSIQPLISLLVLSILGVICVGIFYTQFHFNPAVKAFSEHGGSVSFKPANAAMENKGSDTGAKTDSREPVFSPPEGFSALTSPEYFTPETLSDKIDGKAELYLPAGFENLTAQRFKSDNHPDRWFEIYVYDMGSLKNAFAVFSAQRREDARYLSFADHAYITENAMFWVHGPYYLEIIASAVGDTISDNLVALAKKFNRSRPVEQKAIEELSLFPSKDLVPRSFSILSANAFGYEALDNVFTARYHVNDTAMVTAFISVRNSSGEAQKKADGFYQFFEMLGGKQLETALADGQGRLIEFFGTHEAFFTVGPIFAGVHEAPDQESAETVAGRLFDKLSATAK